MTGRRALVIDLAGFEAPLPEVRLPPAADGTLGRELQVRRLTAAGFRLRNEAIAEGDDAKAIACVRLCLPEITDAEIDRLSTPMVMGLLGIAADKIDEVLAILGNVAALSGAARTTTAPPQTEDPTAAAPTAEAPPPATSSPTPLPAIGTT